jgi:putative ABC transport system ATP-binding protein
LPGELVVMTGPSGSGKTTLLTLVGALRSIQQGSVQALGRELFGMKHSQLTEMRREIGFIFQQHNLFEALTAIQNVCMALELREHSREDRLRKANFILERLGLADRTNYKPKHLSGGQRQRVAIARALANRPKLILADEPTAALDKEAGSEVLDILKELAEENGSTILLVSHDPRILDRASRIVNMVDGRIASEILVEETVKIIEFLVRYPLFANSTPAALTEISQKMVKERFTQGTAIINQGEPGDKFYVIRDGLVQVTTGAATGGQPTVLAELGPGGFFGEAALMTDRPRNATVIAGADTITYSLHKADFLTALAASPSFQGQLREAFFNRQ